MTSLKDLFYPKLKIILMLYSRDNVSCAEPLFESNNSLNVRFNPSKKTVWIIHGYRPLGSIPAWLHKFTKVLLKHEDVNLIVVDWNQGATTLIYNRAVKNTRLVAEHLRESIQILLVSLKNWMYSCYTVYGLLYDTMKLRDFFFYKQLELCRRHSDLFSLALSTLNNFIWFFNVKILSF